MTTTSHQQLTHNTTAALLYHIPVKASSMRFSEFTVNENEGCVEEASIIAAGMVTVRGDANFGVEMKHQTESNQKLLMIEKAETRQSEDFR